MKALMSSLLTTLRLAVGGIAYRRSTAVIVLLLAVVASTAAVVAPLYSRAAEESIARGALVRSTSSPGRCTSTSRPSASTTSSCPRSSTKPSRWSRPG